MLYGIGDMQLQSLPVRLLRQAGSPVTPRYQWQCRVHLNSCPHHCRATRPSHSPPPIGSLEAAHHDVSSDRPRHTLKLTESDNAQALFMPWAPGADSQTCGVPRSPGSQQGSLKSNQHHDACYCSDPDRAVRNSHHSGVEHVPHYSVPRGRVSGPWALVQIGDSWARGRTTQPNRFDVLYHVRRWWTELHCPRTPVRTQCIVEQMAFAYEVRRDRVGFTSSSRGVSLVSFQVDNGTTRHPQMLLDVSWGGRLAETYACPEA
ncbi:hypothetical protein J3F83DRAFT_141130 [Trichoderma novae-zelandiae]